MCSITESYFYYYYFLIWTVSLWFCLQKFKLRMFHWAFLDMFILQDYIHICNSIVTHILLWLLLIYVPIKLEPRLRTCPELRKPTFHLAPSDDQTLGHDEFTKSTLPSRTNEDKSACIFSMAGILIPWLLTCQITVFLHLSFSSVQDFLMWLWCSLFSEPIHMVINIGLEQKKQNQNILFVKSN